MAKKTMEDVLAEIAQMQKEDDAVSSIDKAPQVQKREVVEAEYLPQQMAYISKEGDVPKDKSIADMQRINLNKQQALSESSAKAASDLASQEHDEALKAVSGLKGRSEQMQQAASAIPNIDSLSEQAMKKYLSEKSSLEGQPKPDQTAEVIAALMPGLLGLAIGGKEAGFAAKDAQGTVDKALEAKRKSLFDERKARLDALGKEAEGIGSMRKAELDYKTGREKNALNYQQLSKDYEIKAAELLASGDKEAAADAIKYAMQFDKAFKENVGDVSKTAISEAQIQAGLDKAKISAEASKQRMFNRPPTQGMIKNAEAFAAMTKADQAMGRMLADNKGKWPSLSSKSYGYLKSAFESNSKMEMGAILQQIPNPIERRQIQAELDWLAPKLRADSGAAITVAEYIAEGNRYFPRSGDDSSTIQEKEASRQQAMDNYKANIGTANVPKIVQPKIAPKPVAPKIDYKAMSREDKIKALKGGK